MGSKLESQLYAQVTAAGLEPEEREYCFAPTVDGKSVRAWRADWAYPSKMLLVEIDGGIFAGGRHTRGPGFVKDARKRNVAQIMGWSVIVLTDRDKWKGRAVQMIEIALHHPESVGLLLDDI